MNLSVLTGQIRRVSILLSKMQTETTLTKCRAPLASSLFSVIPCSGSKRWKGDDIRDLMKSMPLKDMGTQGEKQLDVDLINVSKQNVYPDADTANRVFDGVKYSDLPIAHIKASKNNTIIQFTDKRGAHLAYRSCGMDGFKNTRKGTNIAAQTTAIAISNIAKERGISNVRVLIQGLGPGRMSAVKGLQMAGIKVVSVSDATPVSFKPPRPRKARRL